jgi:hypothetical protein
MGQQHLRDPDQIVLRSQKLKGQLEPVPQRAADLQGTFNVRTDKEREKRKKWARSPFSLKVPIDQLSSSACAE